MTRADWAHLRRLLRESEARQERTIRIVLNEILGEEAALVAFQAMTRGQEQRTQ